MSASDERLYNLLPGIVRMRDAVRGEPLRALTLLLEEEFDRMEEGLDTLYDNIFVETCEEWVAPYIGDLVRAPQIHPLPDQGISERAVVGNTIAYRRRKGTLGVIEALSNDAADWTGHAVEFRRRLAWSPHLNHQRSTQLGTADLRNAAALVDVGGPFDTTQHHAEVRQAHRGGKYHLDRLGLYVWRAEPQELVWAEARPDPSAGGRYHFSPRGGVLPLLNRPDPQTTVEHVSTEQEVPGLVRRRALFADLKLNEADRHYLGNDPVFRIKTLDDVEVDPDNMVVANLKNWWRPPTGKVAVDPELGRICYPVGATPGPLLVNFRYGAILQIGGGPYDRTRSVDQDTFGDPDLQFGVTKTVQSPPDSNVFETIEDAISAWNDGHAEGDVGVITLMDSRTYAPPEGGWPVVELKTGAKLLVIAADWPVVGEERTAGTFFPEGPRPLLLGNLMARGVGTGDAELTLNGLDVAGRFVVAAGALEALNIAHCRFQGASGTDPNLRVMGNGTDGWNAGITVTVTRSVCAGMGVAAREAEVAVTHTAILSPDGEGALRADDGDLTLSGCTVLGWTIGRSLDATNCIFDGVVKVERNQTGAIRHSYVPAMSHTPRRFRCIPDIQTEEAADDTEVARARSRARPIYVSKDPHHAEFLQIARTAHHALRFGADDGGEMGVTHHLGQVHRVRNLARVLQEFGPMGAELGLYYVSREFKP